jgi:hypothetical protein
MKLSKGDRILIAFGLVVVCAVFLLYTLIYSANPWMQPIITIPSYWFYIIPSIAIILFSTYVTYHFVHRYLEKMRSTVKEAIKEGIKEGLKESEDDT